MIVLFEISTALPLPPCIWDSCRLMLQVCMLFNEPPSWQRAIAVIRAPSFPDAVRELHPCSIQVRLIHLARHPPGRDCFRLEVPLAHAIALQLV